MRYMFLNKVKVITIFFLLLICLPIHATVSASEKPEIFVDIYRNIYNFAISPDGRFLAILDWLTLELVKIKIYSTENGRLLKEIKTAGSATSVFFTPDGKNVVVYNDNETYEIYELINGNKINEGKLDYSKRYYMDKELIVNPKYESYSFNGRYLLTYGIKIHNYLEINPLKNKKTHHKDLIFEIAEDGYFKTLTVKKQKDISRYEILRQIPYFEKAILSSDRFLVVNARKEERNSKELSSYLLVYDLVTNKEAMVQEESPITMYIAKEHFGKYLTCVAAGKWIVWNIMEGILQIEGGGKDKDEEIKKYLVNASKNEEGAILLVQEVVSSDGKLYAGFKSGDGEYITVFNAENKELARFYYFADGEWVVITPEGYYNASPNGDKHLNVRIGNNVYSIEKYREAFYRPDIVKLALAGKSIENLKTIAEVKQPPIVSIINTPIKTEKDEVKVTLRIQDQGGGIGDIRLYLNGTSIMLDRARGIALKPKEGDKALIKEYTVKLINGENIITAVAFNEENTMQSNPATHRIMAEIRIFKKPSLYAVVIGINEYKNPKLTLKYAVADVQLFANTLKQISSPLFENIQIKTLTTKEETTKETIKKTLNELKNIRPDDVFVFYVAAHGTVDEGEYFLLTSNVGSVSTFRLKEDALTQAELKELIANIPSTKKLIIIDTCSAGKLGEALQVAMLTRGMSEEIAVKLLSHAVGSTIISASTAIQEALEGYQGHGLFTYVLVEGLKGKADTDRDGFIKTLELANYVDSEVPVVAEKVFKHAQYPTVTPTGVAFPIGKVK